MSELDPRGAIPPAPGPTPAGEGAYVQQLHRALSMKENILVTLSAVTPMSSSSVVTPMSRARSKAGIVFSGASPRAPRWPCRSKAQAPVASINKEITTQPLRNLRIALSK